jgi:hypothetical protein
LGSFFTDWPLVRVELVVEQGRTAEAAEPPNGEGRKIFYNGNQVKYNRGNVHALVEGVMRSSRLLRSVEFPEQGGDEDAPVRALLGAAGHNPETTCLGLVGLLRPLNIEWALETLLQFFLRCVKKNTVGVIKNTVGVRGF